MRSLVIACSVLCLLMAQGALGQTKLIPVVVKVEAEGGSKSQGMWVQEAKDLTSAESRSLESFVAAEVKKQDDVKIVSLDYPEDCIGIAVVAAKLPGGRAGKRYYVASSAVVVSKKGGADEFVTHDVFVGTDLPALARIIAYQFASVRLRAAMGFLK